MIVTTKIGKSLALVASDIHDEASDYLRQLSELYELVEVLIDSDEIDEIVFDRALLARRRGAKKERLLEILKRRV
jgi:hypothetical protein